MAVDVDLREGCSQKCELDCFEEGRGKAHRFEDAQDVLVAELVVRLHKVEKDEGAADVIAQCRTVGEKDFEDAVTAGDEASLLRADNLADDLVEALCVGEGDQLESYVPKCYRAIVLDLISRALLVDEGDNGTKEGVRELTVGVDRVLPYCKKTTLIRQGARL